MPQAYVDTIPGGESEIFLVGLWLAATVGARRRSVISALGVAVAC
jgi:hypothetical protein